MRGERLRHTIRLFTILTSTKRTEYLKKKNVFGAIGNNCNIMNRIVPLYPKLIKLGNNVRLASNVTFVTHDISHFMLNANPSLNGERFDEKLGCIEVKDNVFIGAGTTILYGVMIGSNVIIGAGSLVNRDIPSNSVVAGIPAKVIGTFDDFVLKRRNENSYPEQFAPHEEYISDEAAEWCWSEFYKSHNGQ